MADIILATILLLGGLGWSFVYLVSFSMHPTPSQVDIGVEVWIGPIAALIGFVWWGWIIWGWL